MEDYVTKPKFNTELGNIKYFIHGPIMIVVSNSLVRIPETVNVILCYVVMSNREFVVKSLCLAYSNCTLFLEIANVFYITSLCFYKIFYVKFNKNLKFSFLFSIINDNAFLSLTKIPNNKQARRIVFFFSLKLKRPMAWFAFCSKDRIHKME